MKTVYLYAQRIKTVLFFIVIIKQLLTYIHSVYTIINICLTKIQEIMQI